MDVVQSKRMCRKKERIFNQLARRYDVDENNYDWDTIAGSKDSWIEQLNEALNELVETAEEMIDDHRNAMGGGEVQAWQSSIKEAEKVYALTIKKFYRPNPNGIQLPSSASLPPVQRIPRFRPKLLKSISTLMQTLPGKRVRMKKLPTRRKQRLPTILLQPILPMMTTTLMMMKMRQK